MLIIKQVKISMCLGHLIFKQDAHLLRLGKAIEFFESCFYDIMTTQYDHPRYVKHVLAHINVVYTLFIPYFGCVLLGIDSLRGGLAEGNRIFLRAPLVFM